MNLYESFAQATQLGDLHTCLMMDMKACQEDDVRLLCYLTPSIYTEVSSLEAPRPCQALLLPLTLVSNHFGSSVLRDRFLGQDHLCCWAVQFVGLSASPAIRSLYVRLGLLRERPSAEVTLDHGWH